MFKLNKGKEMAEKLYHEITPEGFGIAIENDKDLFSDKSPYQAVDVFHSRAFGNVLTFVPNINFAISVSNLFPLNSLKDENLYSFANLTNPAFTGF